MSYEHTFSLPENLYTEGSPVTIAAGALQPDPETGRLSVQLKLCNISPKPITTVSVAVLLRDEAGAPLGQEITHQFTDLNAHQYAFLCQKSPIPLPDDTARSFDVRVTHVIHLDNTLWTAPKDAQWLPLATPRPLTELGDAELAKQFELAYGKSDNLLTEDRNLWICTCGIPNLVSCPVCGNCGRELQRLRDIDLDQLAAARDARLAKEAAEAPKPQLPPENSPEEKPAKKQKKSRSPVRILLTILASALVLALVFTVVQYRNCYEDAAALAENMEFGKARETLFLPAVTEYHDPDFLRFLEAGNLMDSGQYEQAHSIFQSLANAGYRNADDMVLENSYRQGCALLNGGEFEKALEVFEQLEASGYAGAADKALESSYLYAADRWDHGQYAVALNLYEDLAALDYADSWDLYGQCTIDYAFCQLTQTDTVGPDICEGALNMLQGLIDSGYPGAEASLAEAKAMVYEQAVSQYHADEIYLAQDTFALLPGYASADTYLILCDAYYGNATLEALWSIRGFEDAEEYLLGSDYLYLFLTGEWRTGNGNYYINLYESTEADYEYWCEYNLPWYDGYYFYLEDGIFKMVVDQNGGVQYVYRFTISTWDSIYVYCYKDGSTHLLYRQ